jgi:hypothetical protein
MNIKTLFTALMLIFIVSCSKEKDSIIEPSVTKNVASQATSPQVNSNTEQNFKAYIFIERQSRLSSIVNHLKTIPRNSQSTGSTFYAYFSSALLERNYRDLNNYYNMVLWTNGTLNKVISVDVPQTTGGVDEHGNNKSAYNFTTVKIPKGTLDEWAWVTVLIPTSAMRNDTKRQTKIASYSKNGNKITSSGNGTQTVFNVNPMLSSYLIYSNGTVIPKGNYRVYCTFGGTNMRFKFNTTNDVYLRGAGN